MPLSNNRLFNWNFFSESDNWMIGEKLCWDRIAVFFAEKFLFIYMLMDFILRYVIWV